MHRRLRRLDLKRFRACREMRTAAIPIAEKRSSSLRPCEREYCHADNHRGAWIAGPATVGYVPEVLIQQTQGFRLWIGLACRARKAPCCSANPKQPIPGKTWRAIMSNCRAPTTLKSHPELPVRYRQLDSRYA